MKRFLRKSDIVRRLLLPKYRILRNYFRYSRILFKFTPSYLPKPENLYWINPKDIIFQTNYRPDKYTNIEDRVFDMWKHNGKIMGGDWDISSFKFEDLEVFKAIKARIQDNIDWKSTKWYQLLLNDLKQGYSRFGCINETELNKRFKAIDSLIDSIKQNGYNSHKTRIKDEKKQSLNLTTFISDEVTVNISRYGKYMFQSGRHRLSAAIVFGIEKIPVKVLVRHKNWVLLRKNLLKIASKSGGTLYQSALHTDLLDIPFVHNCNDRFEAIKKHLPIVKGSLLDVGAYFGYFCHKFEDLDFNCIAVEKIPELSKIAESIKKAVGKKFKIINGDILEPKISTKIGFNYDVVLLLNILHHFLKEEYYYKDMTNWLRNLKTKIIFFEPHLPSEDQMKDAYINYDNNEFLQYIIKQTGKSNYQAIHLSADGRTLFMIT